MPQWVEPAAPGRLPHLRGGGGDDLLKGGEGRDKVDGRGGSDILLGGAGDDKIDGGEGGDLLIGDSGRDDLKGGKDDDLLVGGATDAADDAALAAIRDAWASAASYEDRITAAQRLFGTIDDKDRDSLRGQSGRDWFLPDLGDRIRDQKPDEESGPF